MVTQLCDMLAAGYSAKVTQEDQQGVSVFEDFAKRDLLAFGRGEGEGGGGGMEFQVSGSRCQLEGYRLRVASYVIDLGTCLLVYKRLRFAQMSL